MTTKTVADIYVDASDVNKADIRNNMSSVCPTIAELRTISGGVAPVQVLGHTTLGDGGGGPLRRYVSGAGAGTYVDDDGSVIVPSGGDGSAAWIFVDQDQPSAKLSWWGTDNAAAVAAAAYSVAQDIPLEIDVATLALTSTITTRGIFGTTSPNVPVITLSSSGAIVINTATGSPDPDEYRYAPFSNLFITSTTSRTFVTIERRRVYSRGITMTGSGSTGQIGVLFDATTEARTFSDFDNFRFGSVDYPFKVIGTTWFNSNTIGHSISGNYITNCIAAWWFVGAGYKQGNTFSAYVEASTNVAKIDTNTVFWNTFNVWQDVVTNTMTLGADLGQPNRWNIQDKSNYSYTGGAPAWEPSNDLICGLDDYWLLAGSVNQSIMSLESDETWYGIHADTSGTGVEITASALLGGQDESDTHSRKYRDAGFLVNKYTAGISFYDSTNDTMRGGFDTTGFWAASALQTQALSAGGTVSVTPIKNFLRLNCSVATTVNLGETDVMDGMEVTIVNIGAQDVTFNDSSGVQELAGNFTMGQYDCLKVIYSSDRWIEVSRSNN